MADDWLAEYEAQKAREQELAKANIHQACELLDRLGVETVTVEYDGQGDSGSIESISFDPEPAAGIPDGLDEVIRDAAYDCLPGGWEINDGSFGALEIDVRARKMNRTHNWRVIETETGQEEFNLG